MMYTCAGRFIPFLLIIIFFITCKKSFEPPAIKTNYNYLVVDGFINTGSNAVTSITLSRTRNLIDTITNIPEPLALVNIESSNGNNFPLQEQGNGIYKSQPLNLDITQKYNLIITTSDGHKYSSDFVVCKQVPAIDSLTWKQQSDVTVYVNTHDSSNNTRYYRWDYVETWEYHSQLETIWGVNNARVFFVDSTTQKYNCWSTDNSTNILLGTSAALAQDVISQAPVATIPNSDAKIDVRYSILVNQYALTLDAYNYWQIIQKNSQQLGTLFDLQPSQINGNIHSLNNANEPVIGFVTASSTQQKRIFIVHDSLTNWLSNPNVGYACPLLQIAPNFPNYTYSDTSFSPYYYISNGPLVITKKNCLDCTIFGGTNIKPSFW